MLLECPEQRWEEIGNVEKWTKKSDGCYDPDFSYLSF